MSPGVAIMLTFLAVAANQLLFKSVILVVVFVVKEEIYPETALQRFLGPSLVDWKGGIARLPWQPCLRDSLGFDFSKNLIRLKNEKHPRAFETFNTYQKYFRQILTDLQLLANKSARIIVDYSSIVVRTPVADAPSRGLIPNNCWRDLGK